mmetsp:Transcript_4982/g.13278  ORF Transcript_4982/g.13278 Transcript_4982/m.13278 type:complete len:212 (-) Transcript_4982:374-1009(-)
MALCLGPMLAVGLSLTRGAGSEVYGAAGGSIDESLHESGLVGRSLQLEGDALCPEEAPHLLQAPRVGAPTKGDARDIRDALPMAREKRADLTRWDGGGPVRQEEDHLLGEGRRAADDAVGLGKCNSEVRASSDLVMPDVLHLRSFGMSRGHGVGHVIEEDHRDVRGCGNSGVARQLLPEALKRAGELCPPCPGHGPRVVEQYCVMRALVAA